VADFPVTRTGAILAVSDFGASLRFYRDQLGLTEAQPDTGEVSTRRTAPRELAAAHAGATLVDSAERHTFIDFSG
jgi:catechol 2,3-dioxygenase-like lactoylglutathione lyase family enzyme